MLTRALVLAGIVAVGGTVAAQDGIISTVAGTRTPGHAGDGGQAVNAQFELPVGVAVAADGTRYVADAQASVIRKIDPSGVITTIAGTPGEFGFSGDDGPAIGAFISAPLGIAVDASGNVYFSDAGNRRVRRIAAADGSITTVAGNGDSGYSNVSGVALELSIDYPAGLAVGPQGYVYIAAPNNGMVYYLIPELGALDTVAGDFEQHGASSGDGGQARSAGLHLPCGVAVASDATVYIAEQGAHRIRKVALDGTITTLAGTGTAGYSGDGGLATTAQLSFDVEYPSQLAIDDTGALLIADSGNSAVRRIDASACIETYAGTGVGGFSGDGQWAFEGQLMLPYAVASGTNGDLVVADSFNYALRKVSRNFSTQTGSNVTVDLGSEASLTFEQVTSSGDVSIDVVDTVPTPAPGYVEVNGKYYDINVTGGFTGAVTLAIGYDDAGLSVGQERQLKLLHFVSDQWVDVTTDVRVDVNFIDGQVTSFSPVVLVLPSEGKPLVNFRRGDANDDGAYDVSDAVSALLYLFAGRTSSCLDALDANDDGSVDISDPVAVLDWLFLGGKNLPPPGPDDTGLDQTDDGTNCDAYQSR
ncbi:MAG: hypothetical protein G01um101431_98 [Parcubacteria group bacterium Gr01-1014_31]|nr:MAG: hypothetical protein G01um101431_98 [Parcubacteria group bacterium Gr01-1014_31]